MLKALLKNLPFNPSLIEHVPGHIKSIRRDQAVRISALFFFLLAIVIQICITASPAQPTLMNSPNDLINGGFNSKTEAVTDCINNTDGYKKILSHFDISCVNLSNSFTANLKSSDYGGQLYSINRLAYGRAAETSIYIKNQTYWSRNLNSWPKVLASSFKTLSGTDIHGQPFYLLYSSGNLVLTSQPISDPNCETSPNNCVRQSISVRDQTTGLPNANGNTVHPGDELVYTVASNNPSSKTIKNYTQVINVSNVLAYASVNGTYSGKLTSGVIGWPKEDLKPGQTMTNQFSVLVDKKIPKTPVSSTDPGYFNSSMTIAYGNVLNVKLPLSFSKFIETYINDKLTYESKLVSLITVVIIALVMFYFIGRNYLFVEELHKIRDEFSNSDGK